MECSCEKCVSACKNYPGRLLPQDLRGIADFLGISTDELVDAYLVVEYVENAGRKMFMFSPAKLRRGGKPLFSPGEVVEEWYLTKQGRCIFLDSGDRCSIHPVKPFECREYLGCRNTFMGKPYKQKTADLFFFNHWRGHQGIFKNSA